MVGFESPPPWNNNRNDDDDDDDDSPLSSSGSVIAQGSQLLLLLLPPPVVIRARVVLVVSIVVVVVVIRAHFRISGCEKSHNRDKVCVCARMYKSIGVCVCVCVCTVGYQYTNRGVMICCDGMVDLFAASTGRIPCQTVVLPNLPVRTSDGRHQ